MNQYNNCWSKVTSESKFSDRTLYIYVYDFIQLTLVYTWQNQSDVEAKLKSQILEENRFLYHTESSGVRMFVFTHTKLQMRSCQILFVLTKAIIQWSFQSRIKLPLRLINAKYVTSQQKVSYTYCGIDKMPSR